MRDWLNWRREYWSMVRADPLYPLRGPMEMFIFLYMTFCIWMPEVIVSFVCIMWVLVQIYPEVQDVLVPRPPGYVAPAEGSSEVEKP